MLKTSVLFRRAEARNLLSDEPSEDITFTKGACLNVFLRNGSYLSMLGLDSDIFLSGSVVLSLSQTQGYQEKETCPRSDVWRSPSLMHKANLRLGVVERNQPHY